MIIEYPDYTPYLTQVYPEISKERKDVLNRFVKGLGMLTQRYREDEYTDRGFILPYKVLRSNGVKPETFHKVNDKYPMIECINDHYSYKWGVAKVYAPTEKYVDMLRIAGDGVEKKYSCDGKNKPHITPDYQHTCRIDVDGLKSLSERYRNVGNTMREIQCLKLIADTEDGVLTQYYLRKPCKRLFAMNSNALQNVSSEVRDVALKGCYRYDASNCHFAICARYSNDPFIQEYVRNPEMVREVIADSVGITPKEVKLCLIKILYGANTKYIHHKNSLVETIGKHKAEEFLMDAQVRGIVKGIDDVARRVINKFGKIEGKTVHQTLAHHLMTIEAKMLDACIAMCPDVRGLYFDGFVSGVKMDTVDMQVAVMKETDILIHFTEEVVGG